MNFESLNWTTLLLCVHASEAKSTSSQYSLHGEDPFTTTLFRPKIAAGGNE